MSSGFDGLPALPEPEWHDNPPMYGQRQMWAYAIEHARQLAEQRAELLEALEKIANASRDEGGCYYTNLSNIRVARKALANATQQRNATGGEG